MQRPQYHYVSYDPKKNIIKDSALRRIYVAKKDVDNMVKFALDSLNGVVYKDDAQIVNFLLSKFMLMWKPILGMVIFSN